MSYLYIPTPSSFLRAPCWAVAASALVLGAACGPPRTRAPRSQTAVAARTTGGSSPSSGAAGASDDRDEPPPPAASDPPPEGADADSAVASGPPKGGPPTERASTPPVASQAPREDAPPPPPAVDPEAGDTTVAQGAVVESTTSAPSVVPAGPIPSRVQEVPSRLEEPLRRRHRHGRPEVENIPDPSWVDPTVLVLARICVSEAGWEGERDCQGIFQVLRNVRRNNETFMGIMRRASRVVSEMWEPTTTRHRWLVNLDLEGTRPDGFPPELDWERHYRHRWMKVIDYARALIEGKVYARPCRGAVIAWGGAMDDYLALRRNLVRANCGDTENTFWKRPPGYRSNGDDD